LLPQKQISKLANRLYQEAISKVGKKIARREPRDLYDLWFILRGRHLEHPEEVITGLSRKLASREGRASDVLVTRLGRVEAVLRKGWETRLGVQVDMLPAFEDCFRDVKQLMGAFDRLRVAEISRNQRCQ
jgi:predicted nucleotidyltransferase component of viral defense system